MPTWAHSGWQKCLQRLPKLVIQAVLFFRSVWRKQHCPIKPVIRCQKPAVWGPWVWLYLLGGGAGVALGVGDQEWELGTENRPASSLPSLVSPDQLSPAASLHLGAALCHKFTAGLAEHHSRHAPVCLCLQGGCSAWGPGHLRDRKWQGNPGVMGSLSERCLAGDRARWGWGSSVFPPSQLAPTLLDLPQFFSPLDFCMALPSP